MPSGFSFTKYGVLLGTEYEVGSTRLLIYKASACQTGSAALRQIFRVAGLSSCAFRSPKRRWLRPTRHSIPSRAGVFSSSSWSLLAITTRPWGCAGLRGAARAGSAHYLRGINNRETLGPYRHDSKPQPVSVRGRRNLASPQLDPLGIHPSSPYRVPSTDGRVPVKTPSRLSTYKVEWLSKAYPCIMVACI